MMTLQKLLTATACITTLSLAGCNERCEPRLCVDQHCGVGEQAANLTPGSAVDIRYIVPAGVDTDEMVEFRIETPCSCVIFERTVASTGATDRVAEGTPADDAACSDGGETIFPFVIPEGGACRTVVTVRLENDTRTLVLTGSDCDALSCPSDVGCTGAAAAPSSETGQGGAGGGA